jgi:hypothetical protein
LAAAGGDILLTALLSVSLTDTAKLSFRHPMLRAAKITEISAKGRRTSAITVEKNFFHH